MNDLICRNTMRLCQTPGMCSPHNGCRPAETQYATIDRDELKRLQADSAELARMRDPVDLVTVGYLHLDATIGGGWRVSGHPLSERKIYEGALQQPLVRLSEAQHAIAQAGQVPEGFVLVPVEPTPEMLEAGSFSNPNANRLVYKAMLAAAPKGDSHE